MSGFGYTNQQPTERRPVQTRTLSFSAFPVKWPSFSESAVAYFNSREIIIEDLPSTVYPTADGICFMLHGVIGYVERVFTDRRRWMYPKGMETRKAVYPLIVTNSTTPYTFIVEGPTDALAIWQCGHSALSTLGVVLTKDRIELVRRMAVRPVVIPDNDPPGINAAAQWVRYLPGSTIRMLPLCYKDICDMPLTERRAFLNGVQT